MPRKKINLEKIHRTIDGFMEGAEVDASELCIAALILDGALEQLEGEAADMLEQLRIVRDARGTRELEQAQSSVAELLRRIEPA